MALMDMGLVQMGSLCQPVSWSLIAPSEQCNTTSCHLDFATTNSSKLQVVKRDNRLHINHEKGEERGLAINLVQHIISVHRGSLLLWNAFPMSSIPGTLSSQYPYAL